MATNGDANKTDAVMGSRENNILRAWLRIATGWDADSDAYGRALIRTATYDAAEDRISVMLAGATVFLQCRVYPTAVETLRAFGMVVV